MTMDLAQMFRRCAAGFCLAAAGGAFAVSPVHRWSFNGSAADSAGGQAATLKGQAAFTTDRTAVYLPGGAKGTSWIDLHANALPAYGPVTIEIWATPHAVRTWSRVFEFGNPLNYVNDNLLMCWTQGTVQAVDGICIKAVHKNDYTRNVFGGFTLNREYHLAFVFAPTGTGDTMVRCYQQDPTTGETLHSDAFNAPGWTLAQLTQTDCWLGHSHYNDEDANASYNEVRVWNVALTEAQLSQLARTGPDVLPEITDPGAPSAFPARLVRGAVEAPGPSSRRGPIAVTEIMPAPASRADGRDLRFVELYNSNPYPARMGGFRLSGDLDYTFPADFSLGAKCRLVIAAVPDDIRAVYGITNVVGAAEAAHFGLPGKLELHDEIGSWLTTIEYADDGEWPAGIDGTGHSLVLARPSMGEVSPDGWARSAAPGGSPGVADPERPAMRIGLLINEVRPHGAAAGFVELVNVAGESADLSGCRIARKGLSRQYVFPAGATLEAGGRLAVDEAALGFPLTGAGMELRIGAPATEGGAVIDAVRVPAIAYNGAWGRAPDGGDLFASLATATPGAVNAARVQPAVVLNELMYHPISETKDDEYIELFNVSGATVDLAGWTLSGGVDYAFTESIPAGGCLVVPKSKKAFRALYPQAEAALAAGSYSGSLANSRDTVRLNRPQEVFDADVGTVCRRSVTEEEVVYRDGGAWPELADGGGSSLERVDPRADARLAASWAASDETRSCAWTTISFTGPIEYGREASRYGDPCEVQLGLLAAGECLVDSVTLKTEQGENLVLNPSFEETGASWRFYGSHARSAIEADAAADHGANVLHVRACERVQTSGNGVRGTLAASLPTSGRGTISVRARWLAGCPELFLRARGNWIEAAGDITTTRAFGTPGRMNGRAANAAPSIRAVTHEPLLPRDGEAVSVYARLDDPDGVASATLVWHVDGSSATNRTPLVAGVGGWSRAVIPAGLPDGALVAFHVEACDGAAAPATRRFPADAARTCLVRYGEPLPHHAFGDYRIWLTEQDLADWTAANPDSNVPVPATFVYGNDRVVYGAGIQYGGSPFHNRNFTRPINNGNIDYKLDFPGDDAVLDDTHMVLATTGNSGNDPTGVKEQYCYALVRRLGLPNLYRRYVHLYANGRLQNDQRIIEDVEKPGSGVLDHLYPAKADGDLFKADDWFEYPTDSFRDFTYDEKGATLESFRTTTDDGASVYRLARYRWNWLKRASKNFTCSDYANFFGLVDAMNRVGEDFRRHIADVVDVPSFVGICAVNQFIGNYDAYSCQRGKNMYLYDGPGGWSLLAWDMDISFGEANGRDREMDDVIDPQNPGFPHIDPVFWKFIREPSATRAFWRAVQRLVSASESGSPELLEAAAKCAALAADDTAIGGFDAFRAAVQTRHANVAAQLAAADTPFFRLLSPSSVTVEGNRVELRGEAPFAAAEILRDGVPGAVEWTTPTTWSMSVMMTQTVQTVTISARGEQGEPLGSLSVPLVSTAEAFDAVETHLAITEIMPRPGQAGGAYLEVFNASSNTTFDLSGVQVKGAVAFTFPAGFLLGPRRCALVVEDSATFSSIYGAVPGDVVGEYTGSLPDVGTLELVRGAATLDRVDYGGTSGPLVVDGASLQRVEPLGPGRQPENWIVVSSNAVTSETREIVPLDQVWSYFNTGFPGSGWENNAFDYSNWQSGPGPLGWDPDELNWPVSFGTEFPLTRGLCTYYFKAAFNYVNPCSNGCGSRFPAQSTDTLRENGWLVHRWSFAGNGADSVGGSPAQLCGSAVFQNDATVFCPGGARGTSWVDLGRNILPADGSPVTIEVWVRMCSVQTWARVFDIGSNTANFLTVGYNSSTAEGFFSINNSGNEGGFGAFTPGRDYHVSFVIIPESAGSTVVCRVKDATTGEAVGEFTVFKSGWTPAGLVQSNCWLGHSQFAADNDAHAVFDECRVWNVALSDEQLRRNVALGPDRLPTFVTGASFHEELQLDYLVDDCAVLYLNGREIHRTDRTPEGTVTDATLATTYTPQELEGQFFGPFRVPADALRTGRNVLAVEVHQNIATSSDIAWGMRLAVTSTLSATASPGSPNGLEGTRPLPPWNEEESTPRVVVNEFMAQNSLFANPATGTFDDWFELYNAGGVEADLSGWIVTDTLASADPPLPSAKTSKAMTFPAGVKLAPGAALLVWTGAMNATNDLSCLQAPFGLGKSADGIYLFDAAQRLVDSVVYDTPQKATVSQGRWPNGTGAWRPFVPPTPGAPNPAPRASSVVIR